MTEKEFNNCLNEELALGGEFTKEDVYNTFERYVENKDFLRKCVNFGNLHYDYVHFKKIMENTLFEEGLKRIIKLYYEAEQVNKELTIEALNKWSVAISMGYTSYTQAMWLSNSFSDEIRFDLLTKEIFRLLGDVIENSLQPHLGFLDSLICIVRKKSFSKKKLGVLVNDLANYNKVLSAIYIDMLMDVSISQWRNIANHGSYRCINDSIEIQYGGAINKKKKIIDKNTLITVIRTIDTILYMHKTAFTLLLIDNNERLSKEVLNKKSEGAITDDTVAQLIETSYSYGFKFVEISKNVPWNFIIESRNDIEKDKTYILEYLQIISAIINSDYDVKIKRKKKIEYVANFRNHTLKIYRFKV